MKYLVKYNQINEARKNPLYDKMKEMDLFTPFEDVGLKPEPFSVNVNSFSIYFKYDGEPTIDRVRDILDATEDFLKMTSIGFDVKYSFDINKKGATVTLSIKNKTEQLKSDLSDIIKLAIDKGGYRLQDCEFISPNKVKVNKFSMSNILTGPYGLRTETYLRWLNTIINDMIEVYDGNTGKKKSIESGKDIEFYDSTRIRGSVTTNVKKDIIKVINQDLYNEAKLRCASLCFPKTKLNMKFDYENSMIEFELKRRRGE